MKEIANGILWENLKNVQTYNKGTLNEVDRVADSKNQKV